MSDKRLTKWEIGQSLIKISDEISDFEDELKHTGNTSLRSKLMLTRALIGDLFNDYNDHEGLGILDSDQLSRDFFNE